MARAGVDRNHHVTAVAVLGRIDVAGAGVVPILLHEELGPGLTAFLVVVRVHILRDRADVNVGLDRVGEFGKVSSRDLGTIAEDLQDVASRSCGCEAFALGSELCFDDFVDAV